MRNTYSVSSIFLRSTYYALRVVAGLAGLEPTTFRLEGGCSIQLSYSPTRDLMVS